MTNDAPAPPSPPTDSAPRLRVAPSPTGDPHVGTAYMTLFNLAYVRKHGGRFVLRIEDTDRARYREDSEQQIYDTLSWLGFTWDEGPDVGGPYAPYRQSERLDTYRPYVEALVEAGHAYHCWCSAERLAQMREEQAASKQAVTGYDRLCHGKTYEERARLPGFTETPVVRMYVPDEAPLTFTDLIRGEVKAPRPDDQVILKADGFPTYHLAVVVDDHEMGITHVVRGEEWISSTPKHVLLYRWLSLPVPQFAHMPLLRNTDKSKISKRKNPAARLTWFREQGYLPEALVNFLALLAYPPAVDAEGNEVEVFSFAEFTERFEFSRVNPVGPVFDLTKLDWLNGVYIRNLPTAELADRLVPYLQEAGVIGAEPSRRDLQVLHDATALIQPRLVRLTDAVGQMAFLYTPDAQIEVDEKTRGQLKENAPEVLDAAIEAISGIDGSAFTHEAVETALRGSLVDGLGIKPRLAFGPVRIGVSGATVSPPLFESIAILGKESTLARLRGLRAMI